MTAITDEYWKSPYYGVPGLIPNFGQDRLYTETPTGIPKKSGGLIDTGVGSDYDYYGASKHAGRNYTFNPDLSYMFQNSPKGGASDKLKGWFKNSKLFAPGAGAKFSAFTDKALNPQFSWNANSGIQGWGKNLGKGLNVANALYQGYNVAKGLGDLSDTRETTDDLVSDIVTASYNNPMLQYDLNAEQMDMLRQLRRGSYDTESELGDIDLLGALGGAIKGGAMGIAGGVPGMVIGAIGGGGNAIIDDLNTAQGTTNAELEALYQAIMESEQQYNALKKQRAYANLAGF